MNSLGVLKCLAGSRSSGQQQREQIDLDFLSTTEEFDENPDPFGGAEHLDALPVLPAA